MTFFSTQVVCSERQTWVYLLESFLCPPFCIRLLSRSLSADFPNVQLFCLFTYLICVLVVFAFVCSVSRGTSSGSVPTPPHPHPTPNEVLQRHLLEDWPVSCRKTGEIRKESGSCSCLKTLTPALGLGGRGLCSVVCVKQPDQGQESGVIWWGKTEAAVHCLEGPSAGLVDQMFLGVSHFHLSVHDPGPWQGSLKIPDNCFGVCFLSSLCVLWDLAPNSLIFKGLSGAGFCRLFFFPFPAFAHWTACFRDT